MKSLVTARMVLLCGALIALVPACTTMGQEQPVRAYVADSVVTSRVKAALIEDPSVSGYAIEVETYNSVVQLSGFVKTHAERLKAIKLAKAVKGVAEIRDAIIVQR